MKTIARVATLVALALAAGVALPSAAVAQANFFTTTPCRLFDSRTTDAPALSHNVPRLIQVTDALGPKCGVPANASDVALNMTITAGTSAGDVVLYPGDEAAPAPPRPGAFPFKAGVTRSKVDIVALAGDLDGDINALATMDGGVGNTVHLILDVFGYFVDEVPPVAVDDNYAAEKDTTLNVSAAAGVTSNDTLNGASIVSYGATTGGEQTTIGAATPTSAGGSIVLNADGSFSYTPPAGAVLIDDTFKYILQNPSGSSTATVTIGVGKASQTISFTSTAPSDATVGGATYTVTATATSGLAVTFTIDASASTVCSISGSTVSFIGNGTCVIDANQAGDANYNPAPQVQQSFAVKSDQTISFTSTAPSDATVGGATYTVTATATSGLAVTFTIDASASTVCSISGSTVSFIGNGTCVIDANQAGDANYYAAPQVQQSFAVKTGQTISFTSTAPSDATVGGATYTVTATATSGLAVTFTIDASASTVCSISGSTVSFIGNGTCVIDANQAGDATYAPAPQEQQSFAVKSDQTISFTSSPPATPTVGGPTYNVTATATSGLAVTFTIDASASTVCSISGSTVSFIGNGTCVIDANQAGDANYYAAPQEQQSFAVKTGQTISFTSTAPSDATVGGATYTVTATATSGLAVTFTIDASASTVCSISGSTVSFIGNGTCVIDANQAGDATYAPAPQEQQSFTVKSDQTISFTSTAPSDATVGGATYTVTATATSGLAVTFTIDASASTVCSISGSTVSFIGNGTCVIDANQAGDANYYAAPQVQQSFAVKSDQTISFTSTAPSDATVGGATYTVTATATSGLAVTFTIDASASTVCSISGSTVSFIGNGTCVIDANQAGDANYYAAPQVQQSFPVVKQDQTISFTSTAPAGAQVGGPTYNVTATATSGLTVTFTIDASATSVCSISGSTVSFIGAGTCVINANQAGDATYNPAPQVQQSFLVVKQDQTITFTSTPPAFATIGGPTYNVTATATSGLTVTFTIDASATSVCSVSGSTVSFTAGGTCLINANQAGNGTYNPAPQVQQSVTVNSPPQPVASPKESFDTIGNTQLEFKAAKALSPSVFVSGNLKDNFTDSDGPSPLSVVPVTGGATTNGGTVDIASNGEFTFTPKAGDTAASDSFGYQVTDGAYTINRTVTVNRKERVWYVKNNATAGGLGRSNDPFDTLAEAQTASLANDYIFVYFGDGTSTGQAAGIALKGGQHLIGEHAGLSVPITGTFNGASNPTINLVTAVPGNQPLIAHSGAGNNAVSATDVVPSEIVGLSLSGGANAIDWATAAAISASGTLTIRDNVVTSAGAEGVDILLAGTGATNLAFHDNNLTATGTALDVAETGSGSLTITAFHDNVVTGNSTGAGINIVTALFDATPGGGVNPVPGGTTVIGDPGNRIDGAGLTLTSVTGTLTFANLASGAILAGDLDIFSNSGPALSVGGGVGGFTFDVTTNAGVLVANAGPAAVISGAAVNLQLNSLTSSNSASTGVSLTNVTGTFSAPSGSAITNAGDAEFSVASSSATVSYAGSISDTSGNDAGVSLTSNTGTISFTGDIDLSTGSSTAFNATGGGTVTATNTDSTLATTTGTALNVTSTQIGAGGLIFKSISANGAAKGIILNSTGTAAGNGGLSVTGTGTTDGSGGTIQNISARGGEFITTKALSLKNINFTNANTSNGGTCTDLSTAGCNAAIYLSGVTTVTLDNINVTGTTAQEAINGLNVSTFTLSNSTLANCGTSGAVEEGCIKMRELTGTCSITGSDLSFPGQDVVEIVNTAGPTLTLNVNNSTFRDSQSSGTGGNGLQARSQGTASMVLNVTSSSFLRLRTNGLQATAINSASNDVDVTTSTFDPDTGIGIGLDLDADNTGNLVFNVQNNTKIYSRNGPAVNVFGDTNATINGRINNNPDVQVKTNVGSNVGSGIRANINKDATAKIEVKNNVVNVGSDDAGIDLSGIGKTTANPGGATNTLDATVTGNNVTIGATSTYGIIILSATNASDTNAICANVGTNAITRNPSSIASFRARVPSASGFFRMEGFVTNAEATWNAKGNTPVSAGGSEVSFGGSGTFAACTAALPTNPGPN